MKLLRETLLISLVGCLLCGVGLFAFESTRKHGTVPKTGDTHAACMDLAAPLTVHTQYNRLMFLKNNKIDELIEWAMYGE